MIHEDDVLLARTLREGREYPDFAEHQVITPLAFRRLDGRRVRRAYYTPGFHEARDAHKVVATIKRHMARTPSDLPMEERIARVATSNALEICSCGFPDGTFACKIRHIHLNTGDAKAARDVTPVRSRDIEVH